MRFGSLFSGIGGFDLGLERAGMECAWQVEIDEYCLKVLEKHWPSVSRYTDVRECGRDNLEPVDLIVGGFPCQPHSVAGKRKGAEDDRNLWPEFLRIIREVRPTWVIAENVPGIVSLYLDTVLADLEGEAYTCWTFNIPACAFDAPHRRERIWIVAYAEGNLRGTPRDYRSKSSDGGNTFLGNSEKLRRDEESIAISGEYKRPKREIRGSSGIMAYSLSAASGGRRAIGEGDRQERESSQTEREGLQPRHREAYSSEFEHGGEDVSYAGSNRYNNHSGTEAIPQGEENGISIQNGEYSYWQFEPDVGRVAHGVPSRVDRLRSLGNAVVPQVAEFIGRRIMEGLNEKETV